MTVDNRDKKVLTPSHRLWPLFINMLYESISVYKDGKLHSQCGGDLSNTVRILELINCVDTEDTLKFFKSESGFCDCEVLMNVESMFVEE